MPTSQDMTTHFDPGLLDALQHQVALFARRAEQTRLGSVGQVRSSMDRAAYLLLNRLDREGPMGVKALRPDVRVIGVQAAGAAAYPPSLALGRPVTVSAPVTMADGIKVGRPGDIPFKIIGDLVDEVRTVSEDALSRALLLCLERAKLVVEPAGAAPVAALLSDPRGFEGPVVAVLSGGNVDPLLMQRVLRHGMAAAGRYLSLRLRLTDRPGALAALLGSLSELNANVLDVSHARTDARLGLTEAEVELRLETQGPEHCEEVAAGLGAAGYAVTVIH